MVSNTVLSMIVAMVLGAGGVVGESAPPESKPAPAAERSIDDLIRSMPKAGDDYPAGIPLLTCLQLRTHIINGDLSPKQWSDLLIASRLFKYRRQWPEGSPLVVELHYPAWLGPSVAIRATARLEGGATLQAGRTWNGACGLSHMTIAEGEPALDNLPRWGPVGVLRAGPNTVIFDIEIRTGLDRATMPTPGTAAEQGMTLYPMGSGSSTYWAEARVLVRAPVTLWVTQVAPEVFDAGFTAAASSDMAACVQTSVYPHFWADGKSRGYVAIWWKRRPEDRDLAMGLAVELLRDGRVIESRLVQGDDWIVSTDDALIPEAGGKEVIFDTLLDVLPKIVADPKELARYQLTVRGDAQAARTGWTASRWWSGSFTRPLAECVASDGTLHRAAR